MKPTVIFKLNSVTILRLMGRIFLSQPREAWMHRYKDSLFALACVNLVGHVMADFWPPQLYNNSGIPYIIRK